MSNTWWKSEEHLGLSPNDPCVQKEWSLGGNNSQWQLQQWTVETQPLRVWTESDWQGREETESVGGHHSVWCPSCGGTPASPSVACAASQTLQFCSKVEQTSAIQLLYHELIILNSLFFLIIVCWPQLSQTRSGHVSIQVTDVWLAGIAHQALLDPAMLVTT